jgi:hypothetical protein
VVLFPKHRAIYIPEGLRTISLTIIRNGKSTEIIAF